MDMKPKIRVRDALKKTVQEDLHARTKKNLTLRTISKCYEVSSFFCRRV